MVSIKINEVLNTCELTFPVSLNNCSLSSEQYHELINQQFKVILLDFSKIDMELSIKQVNLFVRECIKNLFLFDAERVALVSTTPLATVLTTLIHEELLVRSIRSKIFYSKTLARGWLQFYNLVQDELCFKSIC